MKFTQWTEVFALNEDIYANLYVTIYHLSCDIVYKTSGVHFFHSGISISTHCLKLKLNINATHGQ